MSSVPAAKAADFTATSFRHIIADNDRTGAHSHRIGAANNISIVVAIVNTNGLEVTCGVAELRVQLAHIDSVGICYAITQIDVALGHRQRTQIADLAGHVLQLRQTVNAGMKTYQVARYKCTNLS